MSGDHLCHLTRQYNPNIRDIFPTLSDKLALKIISNCTKTIKIVNPMILMRFFFEMHSTRVHERDDLQ